MRVLKFMFGIDVLDSRWMAFLVTFSIAHATALMGFTYLRMFPDWRGWLLFSLAPLTALVAGDWLLWAVKQRQKVLARQRRSTAPAH